MTGADLGTSDY